jgi:hypothetical protein
MCGYNETIEGDLIDEVEGAVLHEASVSCTVAGESAASETVSDELISLVVEDSSVVLTDESLDVISGDSVMTLEGDEVTVTSILVDLN